MEPLLRFAKNEYFLSGQFETDLANSKVPILVDPKWEGTTLAKKLTNLPPLANEMGSFYLATSGSSGSPKLVEKRKTELEAEIQFWLTLPEVKELYRGPQVHVQVPLCHLYGLIWGFYLPKALGKEIHLGSWNVPTSAPSLAITTATQLRSQLFTKTPLPNTAIVSGMKFPAPLAQKIRELGGTEIFEIYGSTETGGMGIRDPLRQSRFQLLNVVEVKLQAEEEAEQSELFIKSPFLSQKIFVLNQVGEWKTDEEESEDGFFSTKDMGNQNQLGFYLLGRKDRIIKKKGKRVSLDAVESEMYQLGISGDFICIKLELDDEESFGLVTNTSENLIDLNNFFRKNLPESHLPEFLVYEADPPKLPNGKWNYSEMGLFFKNDIRLRSHLNRLKLSEEKEREIFESQDPILSIVEAVLGTNLTIDETAHLVYEYQMDSLQRIELLMYLEKWIGKKIPQEDHNLSYFFSVAGIREYIKDKIFEV